MGDTKDGKKGAALEAALHKMPKKRTITLVILYNDMKPLDAVVDGVSAEELGQLARDLLLFLEGEEAKRIHARAEQLSRALRDEEWDEPEPTKLRRIVREAEAEMEVKGPFQQRRPRLKQ